MLLSAALLLLSGLATAQERDADRAAALKQFQDRVQNYVNLHKTQENPLPKLKDKATPAEIDAHKKMLAAAIQAARKDAAPGDIFTPEVRPHLLKILRGELKGLGSSQVRTAVKEEKPNQITLRVNEPYPEKAPLSTVPPSILLELPRLPPELEYRFVNHHLLLHDVKANLIVDFMRVSEVMP